MRQGFSFLVCADSELVKDRIAELLAGEAFSPRFFWGDEELPDSYWQALSVPVMMGPPNAVILRRAQEQPDEFWDKMNGTLAMARQSIWPMFCLEGEWKKNEPALPKAVTKSKFWPVARKRNWIWQHSGLSRADLGMELDRFAKRQGLSFAPGVRKILCESLPLSAVALRNELEKIALLAEDNTVLPEHLALLERETAFDIFAFLRALQNPAGRKQVWTRVLTDPAMTGGDMIFPINNLLVREARLLWRLLHGEDSDVPLYPSLKAEKKKLAQKLGAERISALWDIALRADTDIKLGRQHPEQALEFVIREVQRLW